MNIIKFEDHYQLDWLYTFKCWLKKNYKKMFYPKGKDYNKLWEIYNNAFIKAQDINLQLPNEMEYPLYEDFFLTDTGFNNHTQYYKNQYSLFCNKMESTILQIEDYLRR